MSRGHRLEIMAPAGCFEALTAAVQAGADSVYFGVEDLNMRSHSANNFTLADLPEIVRYCSEHDVKTYLALNIILYDEDVPKAYSTLDAAKAAGVTAVIASDITTIEYAHRIGLEVHISTQLNISNTEALRFYSQYADVVVLARELNLEQVRAISDRIASEGITGPSGRPVQIEMFCHGALCMAVSGKCYLSLHENGKSDNKYIMSPKDLCTIEFLDKMAAAGVSVFKIEGRARPAEYVQKVVSAYRAAADAVEAGTFTPEFGASFRDQLSQVFNRGFWDGYYQGARLGEWSSVYGSSATMKKVYAGKVNNYFSNLGVAEILVEAAPLKVGQHILIIGPTTGVVEMDIPEIRVDLVPSDTAPQGVAWSGSKTCQSARFEECKICQNARFGMLKICRNARFGRNSLYLSRKIQGLWILVYSKWS